jgi:hypothetical protein
MTARLFVPKEKTLRPKIREKLYILVYIENTKTITELQLSQSRRSHKAHSLDGKSNRRR